jgi:hypothetical protein
MIHRQLIILLVALLLLAGGVFSHDIVIAKGNEKQVVNRELVCLLNLSSFVEIIC